MVMARLAPNGRKTSVTTADFAPGGYRYIPAVFQYSGGVAGNPGCAIERVRFHTPVRLAEGFARIAEVIKAAGRPLTAFCACKLRSPAPFTDQGFRDFNRASTRGRACSSNFGTPPFQSIGSCEYEMHVCMS